MKEFKCLENGYFLKEINDILAKASKLEYDDYYDLYYMEKTEGFINYYGYNIYLAIYDGLPMWTLSYMHDEDSWDNDIVTTASYYFATLEDLDKEARTILNGYITIKEAKRICC